MIRQVSHGPRGGHALLAGLKRPATSPATFNSAVDLETLTRIPEFTPTPQSDCAQIVPNFVSKHVRQHCVAIARNRMKKARPPREPSAVPSFAAVMMADVSGYSTLTSILAERGSTGVDLLGKTMKGYLDRIIATILTHDGDIVKFAGDAVIVYWKLQSHEAETEINRGELVLKAAFCCMDLLNSLGTYDINVPNCSTKVLRLHLGIGAGQIYDVHVGGSPGRWEHFIAGDALRQLSQVLDLAKAGELAMSHAALKWFSSVVDIETIRVAGYDKRCVLIHGLEKARRKIPRSNQAPSSGPAELELSLFSDILHSYINESALFKLQADINQSNLFRLPSDLPNLFKLQEIRQITTVFIKLDTIISKWESGDALKIAQSTMQCVQEALIKYEGSLRQFHVDDKGAVMLAFFGLPPLAHLNDASHGIKAVLEIRHRLMDLLDEFSIGVTTGVVSIGGVGINDRTEYAVMGDSINMAARLMCHPEARNAMLCDEKTYILCKNEFEFEKLGETKVKGKANPIRIFRPLSARLEAIHDEAARAQISKEIIGRAREKDLIFSVLHSFDKEEVGVAVLEADGGQGLSTLFGFTKEEALGGGCLTCCTYGTEMEKSTSFYPFRSITSDLLRAIEDAPTDDLSPPSAPHFTLPDVFTHQEKSETNSRPTSIPARAPVRSMERLAMASSKHGFQRTNSRGEASFRARIKAGARVDDTNSSLSKIESGSSSFVAQRSNGDVADPEPTGPSGREETQFEVRVKKALTKIREPAYLSNLFDIIFPFDPRKGASFVSTNASLRAAQAQIRIKELTELLKRMLTTVARARKTVLILHEAQWMDLQSWELLWDIASSCPQVAIFIFSRPDRSYESVDCANAVKKIKRLTRAFSITIEGFSVEETKQMILHSWPDQRIKSFMDKIVHNVYKRSNGNPLYVRSLVLALKETGQWRIDDQGCLCTLTNEFNFDKVVIGGDLQNIVVAQFDRLNRNFQLLLKIACAIGQRFLISDVFQFLSEMPGILEQFKYPNFDEVCRVMMEVDKYGYLHRVIAEPERMCFEFKSAVVRRCIYSMMMDSQRQQLHLSIAQYYEEQYERTKSPALLTLIYEHYNETDDAYAAKKVKSLEKVAHFYYAKHMPNEAVKHYESLFGWVNSNTLSSDFFPVSNRATWHRELGESYFRRRDLEKAKEHLNLSLNLLECRLPSNKIQLFLQTKKEITMRARYSIPSSVDSLFTLPFAETAWNKLNNSEGSFQQPRDFSCSSFPTRAADSLALFQILDNIAAAPEPTQPGFEPYVPPGQTGVLSEEDEFSKIPPDSPLIRLYHIKQALMTLSQVYLLTGQTQECKFTIFKGINIAERFPRSTVYAKFLALAGHVFWSMERRRGLCLRHLDAADRMDNRTDLISSVTILLFTGETLFLMGLWDEAIVRYNTVLRLNTVVGDVLQKEESLKMQSVITFYMGPHSQSASSSRELYAQSVQEDRFLGRFWGCFMILSNLLASHSSLEETRDMRGTFLTLWQSCPVDLKTSAPLQLARLGLVAYSDHFLGYGFTSSEVWREIDGFVRQLTSHDWPAVLGLHHIGLLVNAVHLESATPLDKGVRRALELVVRSAIRSLTRMNTSAISRPVLALFRGLQVLLQGKRVLAVRRWKVGLVGTEVSEITYLQALLHEQIAKCLDDPTESDRHMQLAQSKYRKVGALTDYERNAK